MLGEWSYDEDSTTTGTWCYSDGSSCGTWASDSSDDTVKYDTTPDDDDEDDETDDTICYDLDTEANLANSQGLPCAWYAQTGHEAECPYMDTDSFVAADLCCACGGGVTETLGELGDNCLDWNEDAGRYYPDCSSDLICVESNYTSVGGSGQICISYAAPEGYDGLWYGQDTTYTGYWYLNDDDDEDSGHWISGDGLLTGFWNYDTDSETTGTWRWEDESHEGTWATDAYNDTIKYDSTPASNETCTDLDWQSSPALLD